MRDTADFDEFYAGTSAQVLGHVFAMTGNRAEAEDAVAEAYARAWQRWHQVRECVSPESVVTHAAGRRGPGSARRCPARRRPGDGHGAG